MTRINKSEYRDKVLACWLGKNVGGTLGMPMEWKRQLNNVSFYTQNLTGDPIPNDDLDIQLLWLIALEEQGIDIDAHVLCEYWNIYLTPHWMEYGISKSNMRQGIPAPLCGTFNNKFKHSCGAFIRSEIWACIAPGCPELAVKYAYEDAIIDHGDGEGTYAEVFCAAIESAAFVVSNIRDLLNIGLSCIPKDCGIAKAVRAVIKAYDSGMAWKDVREMILRDFRGHTHFGEPQFATSKDDIEKGFSDGDIGYDAPSNIAIVVLGLLYGEDGDFDKMICITVNCGEDTDCTAATVGSIWGIMHGTKGIPEKWLSPIGRKLKTCCLNLGELQRMIPGTVDELTDRVEKIASQVLRKNRHYGIEFSSDATSDFSDIKPLLEAEINDILYKYMNKPVYRFPFYTISIDYGCDGPYSRSGQEKTIILLVENSYGKVQANLSVKVYAPENWQVSPRQGLVPCFPGMEKHSPQIKLSFHSENIVNSSNRFVVEFTIEGRPTTMHVPITFLNGDMNINVLKQHEAPRTLKELNNEANV